MKRTEHSSPLTNGPYLIPPHTKNGRSIPLLQLTFLCCCCLLLTVPWAAANSRTSVHLHALLPHHFMFAKELESAFLPSFLQYRRNAEYSRVFKMFHTSGNLTFLHHDDPHEILRTLCKDVLGSSTVTLLNINNPELSERPAANSYILDLAHTLGIPVISWDAEFPGSPKNPEDLLALQIAPTIQHQARAIDKVTGKWNGPLKMLLDREADMVVTSLKINPDRAKAVRFSVPYLETGITIVVSLREGAISPTAFLEPYDYPSWCLILVFSVHATGASIFIFEWLSPYGLNRGKCFFPEHKFSLFRSFWMIWAMLFSAAVDTDGPKGVASRFLANIWALFALVFLASYTANLAAFMITKEEFYDLSGIQDWRLQNPTYTKPPFKYATVPEGSTETNIRSNHPEMYHYMKAYNKPKVDLGIEAVKTGEIQAFIYDATVLEYYVGKDPGCRLRTVGSWYAMTGYGIAFPPEEDNPWIDKINTVIFQLQRSGEMERLQRFWLAGACYFKKDKKGVSNKTLGILNFTSAFILLGAGVLLSVLLLLLEFCYFRFGRRCLARSASKGGRCSCCHLVSLSLGQSLTLEEEEPAGASERARKRCREEACDSEIWYLKRQLDLALLKIDNLENQISSDVAVWTEPDITRQIIYQDLMTDHRLGYGEGGGGRRRRHYLAPQLHWLSTPQTTRTSNGQEPVSRRVTHPGFFDYSQYNGSARRNTSRDLLSDTFNLLDYDDSRDSRSEGGGMRRIRRSPSYNSAIGRDLLIDRQRQANRSRQHRGRLYIGVDSPSNNSESVL